MGTHGAGRQKVRFRSVLTVKGGRRKKKKFFYFFGIKIGVKYLAQFLYLVGVTGLQ